MGSWAGQTGGLCRGNLCLSRMTDDGQQLRAGRKERVSVAERVLDMSVVITFCFRKGQGSDWACAGSFLRQNDCIPNTVQCQLLVLFWVSSTASLSHGHCFSISPNQIEFLSDTSIPWSLVQSRISGKEFKFQPKYIQNTCTKNNFKSW